MRKDTDSLRHATNRAFGAAESAEMRTEDFDESSVKLESTRADNLGYLNRDESELQCVEDELKAMFIFSLFFQKKSRLIGSVIVSFTSRCGEG